MGGCRRKPGIGYGITTVDVMRDMSINPPNAWFYWAETAKFKLSSRFVAQGFWIFGILAASSGREGRSGKYKL